MPASFDGALLVDNFDIAVTGQLPIIRPSPNNLFSKVTPRPERFLASSAGGCGYFLLTADEIRQNTGAPLRRQQLTAGPHPRTADATPIDLRAIKAPIVVVASHGELHHPDRSRP